MDNEAENQLIEMIIQSCKEKPCFSGLFNLDLSVCYFSRDMYLERFGDEPFQKIQMIGKEKEVIQVKKNNHIIELFIACPIYEKNLRIDANTKTKEVLFFGEISIENQTCTFDQCKKTKELAKKEIRDHFFRLSPQKIRKSTFN